MEQKARAASALRYIIPCLEKYGLKWCISGGFSAYLYGVKRPIVDIDIDVETDKKSSNFKSFMEDVKPYTEMPLRLWKDRNFDHYVMDVVFDKQLLSMITTKDMYMMNRSSGQYELFYKKGIPKPKIVEFEGLQLPVLPEKWVIKLKQAFAYPSEISKKDIAEMQRLLKTKPLG